MSTNQTPNYALSQWEAGDQVLRADFNADNAKIDAALAELAAKDTEIETGALKMAYGQYWGLGTAEHTLSLPFMPKAVLIQDSSPGDDTHMIYIGQNYCLAQPGHSPNLIDSEGGFVATLSNSGITTKATSGSAAEQARIALNTSKHLYLYLALG